MCRYKKQQPFWTHEHTWANSLNKTQLLHFNENAYIYCSYKFFETELQYFDEAYHMLLQDVQLHWQGTKKQIEKATSMCTIGE